MQDAALYEKSSALLAAGMLSNISNNNSSGNTSSSPKIAELEGAGEDSERLKIRNISPTGGHMGLGDGSQQTGSGGSHLHPSVMWPNVSTTALTPIADETYFSSSQTQALNNGGMPFQQFQASVSMDSSTAMYHSCVAFTSNPTTGTVLSQQGRRAITGHSSANSFPKQQTALMVNTCSSPKMLPTWNNSQQAAWSPQQPLASLYPPWNVQQRRSVPNMNVLASAPPVKKQSLQQQLQQSPFISPTKFRRSTSFPGQIQASVGAKHPFEFSAFEDAMFQNPSNQYDSVKFPTLENQLLNIMKNTSLEAEGVHMHGDNLRVSGKMPYLIEDSAVEEGSLDQNVSSLPGASQPPSGSQGIDRIERFSRKVFVGGLPPDIDEEEITTAFRRFGALVVDWPHKAESKSYFPPKGYCFLIFQDELSVQNLIESCLMDDDKLYWCVSSPTMKDKPVQIRPWSLSDSDFVMDGSQPLDPRKTIFVGGVPRPLRAVELAMIMDRLYGGVCYAGIDTDPELKYPKGAGRVAFSNQQSYIAAISARFVQLQHGDIDKRVEVKPYVLDDQMCDECHGARCAGKFAPFFCANVTCLQYYCEYCWAQIHSRPGREYHKPLVKEGADRPRAIPFRWC
ncbi:hypothetical protein BsWGS_04365 [Bradybaena similaris]